MRRGSEEEAFFSPAADVTLIPSRCLNKSCSRSFYLHMLTGTSEIPGGGTRSGIDGRRRGEKERGAATERDGEAAFPGHLRLSKWRN